MHDQKELMAPELRADTELINDCPWNGWNEEDTTAQETDIQQEKSKAEESSKSL